MKIRELIRNLGLRLGIADLELSEDGSCSVTFGPDEVIFEQEGEMLFIIAEIGSAEGNEKIFRAMLDANHCGHGSGFGSIGWDCERNSFTLSRVIEGDFNNELFEKQLKLFVVFFHIVFPFTGADIIILKIIVYFISYNPAVN